MHNSWKVELFQISNFKLQIDKELNRVVLYWTEYTSELSLFMDLLQSLEPTFIWRFSWPRRYPLTKRKNLLQNTDAALPEMNCVYIPSCQNGLRKSFEWAKLQIKPPYRAYSPPKRKLFSRCTPGVTKGKTIWTAAAPRLESALCQ